MLNHRRGGFTILDNGAAEGVQLAWDQLYKIARRYHVNELALPDVMGDFNLTKTAVDEVFKDTWHPTNHFGLMGIVQGQTFDECDEMIRYYLGMQGRTLTSIGIPRHLITTLDADHARLLLAEHIRQLDHTIDIHLLGTNPMHITELKNLGRYFRALNVRGVDTSAPFVYAAHGLWIGDGVARQRPDDYFDLPRSAISQKLVDMNIATLKEWVHG
jgi:hypothetical protein